MSSQSVVCADGHLGYAQPVGGVIAYEKQISISGVGFDIGCGNMAISLDTPFNAVEDRVGTIIKERRFHGMESGDKHEIVTFDRRSKPSGGPKIAITEIIREHRRTARRGSKERIAAAVSSAAVAGATIHGAIHGASARLSATGSPPSTGAATSASGSGARFPPEPARSRSRRARTKRLGLSMTSTVGAKKSDTAAAVVLAHVSCHSRRAECWLLSTSVVGFNCTAPAASSSRMPPSRPRASARSRAWVRSMANLIDRIAKPSQNNVVALRVLPWRTTSTSRCSRRA